MNFTPELFYEDVRQLFHHEIYLLNKDFYNEIMNIAKQRHLNLDSKDLDRRCHQLFKLLSKHGKFNLDKFEIYLSRNILETETTNIPTLITNSSSSSSSSDSNELTHRRQHLTTLRNKYLKLLRENQQIVEECNRKEQLISQMNTALFKYRVGVQVLERYEVIPLNESIGQLQQQSNQLKSLTQQAEDLVQDIQSSFENLIEEMPSPSPSSRRHSEGDIPGFESLSNHSPIQTGDSDDIRLLNAAFS